MYQDNRKINILMTIDKNRIKLISMKHLVGLKRFFLPMLVDFARIIRTARI